jgi:hypothetical protein
LPVSNPEQWYSAPTAGCHLYAAFPACHYWHSTERLPLRPLPSHLQAIASISVSHPCCCWCHLSQVTRTEMPVYNDCSFLLLNPTAQGFWVLFNLVFVIVTFEIRCASLPSHEAAVIRHTVVMPLCGSQTSHTSQMDCRSPVSAHSCMACRGPSGPLLKAQNLE